VKNTLGEELYDWMAVLDCLHVKPLHQMPAHMGDPLCARIVGGQQRCESCGQRRREVNRRAEDPWRTVTHAGLWDWDRWERVRDERWRRDHLVSLAHAMGWCGCEPAADVQVSGQNVWATGTYRDGEDELASFTLLSGPGIAGVVAPG
jgi:hypothetical protein